VPIYQQSVTAGRFPGNDIAVAITHEVAPFQIDSPVPGGGPQQTGLGLAAGASFVLAVWADADIVYGHAPPQFRVHRFHDRGGDEPIADIRLVRHHDHQEARALE